MIIMENSKFKVGDTVVLKDSLYRGDWLADNLAEGSEIERTDGALSTAETTVTKVLKREELSVNGRRQEYYYEVSGYPGGRFREDLLEGSGSGGTCIECCGGFYASQALEISFRTSARCFTREEVQRFVPNSVTGVDFSGELWEGTAIVQVKGIWFSAETVVLELGFVFEGKPKEYKVKAEGPVGASLKQFKFIGREALRQQWGMLVLDLAESGNGYFAQDVFCSTLEILTVSEIDTDGWD